MTDEIDDVVEETEEQEAVEEAPQEQPADDTPDYWFSQIPEEERTPGVSKVVGGLGKEVAKLRETRRQERERIKAMEARLQGIQQWLESQEQVAPQEEAPLPDPEQNFGEHLLARMQRLEDLNRRMVEATAAGTHQQQQERTIQAVVQATDNQAAAARSRIEDYDDTLKAGIEGFVQQVLLQNPYATEQEVANSIQQLVYQQRILSAQGGLDFGQRIYDVARGYARRQISPLANGKKPVKRNLGGPGGGAAGGAFDVETADGDAIISRLEALKRKHPNLGIADLQKML